MSTAACACLDDVRAGTRLDHQWRRRRGPEHEPPRAIVPPPPAAGAIACLGEPTSAVTLGSPVLQHVRTCRDVDLQRACATPPAGPRGRGDFRRHIGAEALHQGPPACGERHVGIGTPAPRVEGRHQHHPAGTNGPPDDDGRGARLQKRQRRAAR